MLTFVFLVIRVIIPLLILHWIFHDKNAGIPCVYILSSLLSEAREYFNQQLTASIMQIKLFQIPFCRDIQIFFRELHYLKSMLDLCSSGSGFLLTAPEHRLSLELKIKELDLGSCKNEAKELQSLLDGYKWMDILDESDELLHHRFQLIYAVGSVQGLPDGSHRWCAAEALLGVLQNHPTVAKWINENKHFVEHIKCNNDEAFSSIQVSSRSSMELKIPEFYQILAEALLSNPPHEFDWIRNHILSAEILQALVQEMTLPKKLLEFLQECEINDVLALRGFLVGGILIHCLKKCHRVDYGISRPGKKRISVPFRGADTPSLR